MTTKIEIDGPDMAKARDRWLESDEGKECSDGTTSGQYLRNRLEKAFIAGIKAAERLMRQAAAQDEAAKIANMK